MQKEEDSTPNIKEYWMRNNTLLKTGIGNISNANEDSSLINMLCNTCSTSILLGVGVWPYCLYLHFLKKDPLPGLSFYSFYFYLLYFPLYLPNHSYPQSKLMKNKNKIGCIKNIILTTSNMIEKMWEKFMWLAMTRNQPNCSRIYHKQGSISAHQNNNNNKNK